MSWLQIKKIIILKCHLLLFCAATMNHFSIGLWLMMKSGLYTTGDSQLSGWMQKLRESESISHSVLSDSLWHHGLSMGFSRQEYWSGWPLPSPGNLSDPKNLTCISCITGRFFIIWATREANKKLHSTFQTQNCTKRWSWSLFDGLMLFGGLIHYTSLNPNETITSERCAQQIDKMHQKLQFLQ